MGLVEIKRSEYEVLPMEEKMNPKNVYSIEPDWIESSYTLCHLGEKEILVIEFDPNKISVGNAAKWFKEITKGLKCDAVLIPMGMTVKTMDKDVARNWFKHCLEMLEKKDENH